METDHLYNLLPSIYRLRDAEQGYPLQGLMRVIEEQVNVVEEDISRLYENWFIETCDDWVVPYIGDLIGWRQVHEAGEPGTSGSARDIERNKILIPRRELANTIRFRRRKGTLALLELLANDVAGWQARAVEYSMLLGGQQNSNLPHPDRGSTVDVRQEATLGLINGAFEQSAHTVDVRRIVSGRAAGRYNLPNVGLFVCRLNSYPVTLSRAHCAEDVGPECFTFSVLGNDTPLFTKAVRETDSTGIAEEINLPGAIRRQALEAHEFVHHRRKTHASEAYYGDGKSVAIWVRKRKRTRDDPSDGRELIPAHRIIPADLSGWGYRPRGDRVAVDPVLGRMVFSSGHIPKGGVWVFYHYGFSASIGGGEYDRPISQPEEHKLYRVGPKEKFRTINAALRKWRRTDAAKNPHAVIEIVDSGVYVEQINVHLGPDQSLQLRAANARRPLIRLLDWHADAPDSLTIEGERGSRVTLDGLLISGRSVSIEGEISQVKIRHCTLVPGWTIDRHGNPSRPSEPSLELRCPHARVEIDKSILGSIQVHPLLTHLPPYDTYRDNARERSEAAESGCGGIGYGFRLDPICLHISDSILDATDPANEAIGAPDCVVAHARVKIIRSTVLGLVQVHAIDLAENSILDGKVVVARSQEGCMRFCYVTPNSRTPRRYQCQPDLVVKGKTGAQKTAEETRVKPRFNATRYGRPEYFQLADDCATEIRRGADDESEMGVFHDVYQPQRLANLRARLDEFMPAGMDAAIIFIN
jgi:hypothetical protein